MKLFGTSMFSKYTAPLTLPFVLIFGLVTLAVTFAWIGLAVPFLSACLSPLEDSSPVIYSVLQGLIRFMLLPTVCFSAFLMVHFYQRHYERKKREHNAA